MEINRRSIATAAAVTVRSISDAAMRDPFSVVSESSRTNPPSFDNWWAKSRRSRCMADFIIGISASGLSGRDKCQLGLSVPNEPSTSPLGPAVKYNTPELVPSAPPPNTSAQRPSMTIAAPVLSRRRSRNTPVRES